MKKHLKYIFSVLLLCNALVSFAQELVVKSFTVAPTDISASQYPRNDLNGHPCGLVKVQLAVAGAQFEGNVIQPVEHKVSEYWVYMTEGSKELKISAPDYLPLHINLGDHQISGIVPKTTYVLTLASSQNAVQQTGTLTIRYSPATAMVLIDSEPYQGTNGKVSISLPAGSHSFLLAANGYETQDGSVNLRPNSLMSIQLALSPKTKPKQIDTNLNPSIEPLHTSVTSQSNQPLSFSRAFIVNGVSFIMNLVEGGSITKDIGDIDKDSTISMVLPSFYLGETEVTQALWKAVMGTTVTQQRDQNENGELYGVGENFPMYYISWEECQDFVHRLSILTGQPFRIPTEAEWEFAARGGNKSKGYTYSGSNDLKSVAWISENSERRTHPVKMKLPNELGLYDMLGNVSEWCQNVFEACDSTEFRCAERGNNIVFSESIIHIGDRIYFIDCTDYRSPFTGLRLAMDVDANSTSSSFIQPSLPYSSYQP